MGPSPVPSAFSSGCKVIVVCCYHTTFSVVMILFPKKLNAAISPILPTFCLYMLLHRLPRHLRQHNIMLSGNFIIASISAGFPLKRNYYYGTRFISYPFSNAHGSDSMSGGPESANTGVAPQYLTAFADAMYVSVGTTTIAFFYIKSHQCQMQCHCSIAAAQCVLYTAIVRKFAFELIYIFPFEDIHVVSMQSLTYFFSLPENAGDATEILLSIFPLHNAYCRQKCLIPMT